MTQNVDHGKSQRIYSGPFFVSEAPVFQQVEEPTSWVKVKATTLEGAKRLAVKRARGVTFSVRVAIRNGAGELETLTSLHSSTAITRRRAFWSSPKQFSQQSR